ncbi:hypothetical protein [Salmonirosea aquatica]|uniref:Uncharacterized protein n=1 Tax=Salmonirosea aquatica TaxID=2654236 RepID=A0A7C9FWV7_9BACT|nr:hypothetical protein [Cytophagaceae bacterium SJW1-29]
MTTQIMVTLLGAIICCLLIYLLYRIYNKYCSIPQKLVTVPLQTNRSALLTEQKKVVNERRRQIRGESTVQKTGQTEPSNQENAKPEAVDAMDSGFGEDLGLAIEQTQTENASTLVKWRRSRFADMESAAKELKDIYNRNSKIV